MVAINHPHKSCGVICPRLKLFYLCQKNFEHPALLLNHALRKTSKKKKLKTPFSSVLWDFKFFKFQTLLFLEFHTDLQKLLSI